MTKNLLNRVKQSLESSSKKVHDQKLFLEPNQQTQMNQSNSAVDNYRQKRDRSEYYRSVASNYEVSKMLKKIPVLASQNQELRRKVEHLQEELKKIREVTSRRGTLNSRQNSPEMRQDNTSYIRIQTDTNSSRDLVNSSRYRLGSLSRDRHNEYYRDRQEQENYLCRSVDKKKRNLAKLSSEVIYFFQQQIEQLKHDNERLSNKYQNALKTKKDSSDDLDKIKKDFQDTLKKQEEIYKKQQIFSDQKIHQIQSKLTQLANQNELLKMQNNVLTEKLAYCQVSMAVDRRGVGQSVSMVEKQIWGALEHSRKQSHNFPWQSRPTEHKDNHSNNRIKFNYKN